MYIVLSVSKRNIGIAFLIILISLVLGLFGGAWTYDFLRPDIVEGVYLDELNLGKLNRATAAAKLKEYLEPRLEAPLILTVDERTYTFRARDWGAFFDYQGMVQKAYRIGRQGNWFQQRSQRQRIAKEGYHFKPWVSIDSERFQQLLQSLQRDIATEPISAKWEVLIGTNEVRLISAQDGTEIDGPGLLALITVELANPPPYRLALPLKRIKPRLDTAEAANMNIRQVVATYRTYFHPENQGRTKNILLAAQAINGKIIVPGEVFSFNQAVGPRIPESGYMEAPIIVNGELVPGVGGGVCQVSTTLYNAAVLADLSVVERNKHSLPSAYVDLGRDATVFYDYLDLKLHNETPYPLVIDSFTGPNYLEIRLLGNWFNPWRLQITVEELAIIPAVWEEQLDPSLAPGERRIVKEGLPGRKVRVWKQYIDQRGVILNQEVLSVDTYQPINGVVKVGNPPFSNN